MTNATDNLNQANELGNTIAKLLNTPPSQSVQVDQTVKGLITSLAAKAHELLNPVAIKASSPSDEFIMAAGDTAHIHGNGDVSYEPCPDPARPGHYQSITDAGLTLQSYFQENLARDVVDFNLRAYRLAPDGSVGFYLHPARGDGHTPQFAVKGNVLTTA